MRVREQMEQTATFVRMGLEPTSIGTTLFMDYQNLAFLFGDSGKVDLRASPH